LIKVLVADDHDVVRSGIVKLLEAEEGIRVVGEADCGEDAIRVSREKHPDVVLMDLKMPGMGGVEATRKLMRWDPELKVIAFTAYDDEPYPLRVLQAGAAGYVTKGATLEQMVRAIRNVCLGQRYISVELAQQLVNTSLDRAGASSPFDLLSDRELQIGLRIIAGDKVQQIAESLCLSTKTVNTYRYRLFSKLNVSSDVELTLLAIRFGLLDSVLN
jgi:DNA-binding NarL/FixJ family response regulator